jgi:hypothetical protein
LFKRTCGACWAFAIIAVLELHYYRYHDVKLEFSAQMLIDCGYTKNKELGRCYNLKKDVGGGNPTVVCFLQDDAKILVLFVIPILKTKIYWIIL